MTQRFTLILLWLVLVVFGAIAQELTSCDEREFLVEYPRVEPNMWCIENPVADETAGEWAFTALAFGDDGTLYATRPHTGEVLAMRDTDGDALVDSPYVIADGMRLPNGLAYADGVLYILGDGIVYRYVEGETSVLVDDLPHGRGFMASGITVHENHLYVGIPFPCDFCLPDDKLHGTVLSFALDGSDRQIVARGLRYPAGLEFYEGKLWVTDTARDGLDRNASFLDELNTIDLASNIIPHFGFPYCYGSENIVDMLSDFDCATATPPALVIETHSTPIALQPYNADLYRFLKGDLIVVLAGSFDNSILRGYAIYSIDTVRDDGRIRYEAIMPTDSHIAGPDQRFYDREGGITQYHSTIVNLRGAGIWPHRIFDIAISKEGWIYISANSRIYVLRPNIRDVCELGLREC